MRPIPKPSEAVPQDYPPLLKRMHARMSASRNRIDAMSVIMPRWKIRLCRGGALLTITLCVAGLIYGAWRFFH